MSKRNRPATKDMYWFAHGGSESLMNKNLLEEENESNSLDHKKYTEEQKFFSKDISLTDGSNSSGPPSLERDDRMHAVDKRIAVEERRKLIWEAEQERNDALMKKHMEREAALEARRNAQRSTISFAFGSSVPRNVDTLQSNHSVETDCMSRSFTAASSSHRAELHNNYNDRRSVSPIYSDGPFMVNGTSHRPDSTLWSYSEKIPNTQSGCLVGSGAIIVEDVMSKSMTASISAPRGRRKNDLMPTVPYDRAAAPRVATSSSSRRRSVSMTRLDQLAQPRKHYVEATKANSTASSGTSSLLKDVCSPNRPLSSASEHSGGRATSNVTRRVRSSPRKPRPISIAGTIPDQRHTTAPKLHDVKVSAVKKTPAKKTEATDVKKAPSTVKNSTPKPTEKPKPRPTTAPAKASTPKSTTPKPTPPKTVAAKPKTPSTKDKLSSMANSAKPQTAKVSSAVKKKSDVQVSAAKSEETKADRTEKSASPVPDSDSGVENDKSSQKKLIISEEEARAALAEKRRLAREQAEREAELERQRQEELRKQEEERLRKEEEEQRKMEEESLRLLEEHRRQEDEKLRKAIEDQELKKEEERAKLEEESRLKAEQDRKAKEESEKIRLELEEKLRREEEERAERKKRLEKIMSRTRGKSSGTSPSGSVSGSDHMDSGENQQEGFSSGANSLESNEGAHSPSEAASSDDAMAKMEVSSSGGNSLEAANLTYEFSSNDVSLNSNDLMLPASEVASRENSMVITLNKEISNYESPDNEESGSVKTSVNVESSSDQLSSEMEGKVDPSALKEDEISSEVSIVSQNHPSALKEDEISTSEVSIVSQNHPSALKEDEISSEVSIVSQNHPSALKEGEISSEVSIASQNLEECEIPTFNNTGETAAEQAELEQKTLEDAIVLDNSKKFEPRDELEKEQWYDETSELHNTESSQFDFVKSKEEEINQLAEKNNPIAVAEHSEFSGVIDFTGIDQTSEIKEGHFEENALSPDTPLISDDQDKMKSEDQESFMLHGSEIPAEVEYKLDQSFETDQDPLSDYFAQRQMTVVEDEHEARGYVEQPREIGENLVISGQTNLFTEDVEIPERGDEIVNGAGLLTPEEQVQCLEENAFSVSSENQNLNFHDEVDGEEAHSEGLRSPLMSHLDDVEDSSEAFNTGKNVSADNPFASNFEGAGDESKAFNSENTATGVNASVVDNPFASNFDGAGDVSDAFNFEKTPATVNATVDNPFGSNYLSKETEQNIFSSQFGGSKESTMPENHGFGDQHVDSPSVHDLKDEIDNVTLIKQEGGEKYVGIISSIDNDHLSNSFPKLNEQLTNNLECASTTDDSEDSSLDSNLSQVIAPEDVGKDLNNHTYSSDHHLTSNNTDNPFMTQNHQNQSSIPQSGHYSEFEVYSNGHSMMESSKLVTDYGNSILSVENNIFENVGAIDLNKISSDPFLGKGSSNQISGNPFLMQEEQNPKVLMTSDFLN